MRLLFSKRSHAKTRRCKGREGNEEWGIGNREWKSSRKYHPPTSTQKKARRLSW